jgi:uncharacterized protein (DUF302 family)
MLHLCTGSSLKKGYFKVHRWLVFLVLLNCRPVVAEQNFLRVSCSMPFPEAMVLLQDAIASHGYKVSRVQHVDKGLRKFGYETGLYRVVFFGRPRQMAMVRENHPGLIPYLPLKIMLFEEGEYVVASALEPVTLAAFFDDAEIRQLLDSWQKDLIKIASFFGQCGEPVSESDEIHQSSISYMPVGV